MSELTPLPDYDNLFEEFKQKAEYLENTKDQDRKKIAVRIGEKPPNLSDYLNEKKRPSAEILVRMLDNLNEVYAEELKGWTITVHDDPFVYDLMKKNELRDKATLNVLARMVGVTPEALQAAIDKEMEDLSRSDNQE